MRKQNLPLQKLMSQDVVAEVAAQMRYEDVEALYAAVGEGHVSTQSVLEKVVASMQGEAEADEAEVPFLPKGRARQLRPSDSGVLVRGAPDILVKLAKCCTPGARRRDRRLRHPRHRRLGAPGRLRQRARACSPSPSA